MRVERRGPRAFRIARRPLERLLATSGGLARGARIVPSVRNGRPNGFKLYAIRPGSLLALIGLKNGDTVTGVNGFAINTPDQALTAYARYRRASRLRIAVSRRGRELMIELTIR